jgi:IclR family KDG regulon transcriptional repressor
MEMKDNQIEVKLFIMKKINLESSDNTNDNTSDSRLLVRAIKILEAVALCREPVGVRQIGKMTGIHPTTVFRITRTLCKYGWLIQDEDTQYSIGMSAFTVGCQFNLINDLKEISFYTMQKLSDATKQPVNFMVRQDNMCLQIQHTHSKNVFRAMTSIGSKMPLYITGCGKVLLSGVTDTMLGLIVDSYDYHQYTPNTIRDRYELLRQIKIGRENGYAVDDQESMWGTCCVAVPVFDEAGAVVAALSVACVVDYQKYQDDYVAELKKSSRKITEDLIAHRKERGFISAMLPPTRYE